MKKMPSRKHYRKHYRIHYRKHGGATHKFPIGDDVTTGPGLRDAISMVYVSAHGILSGLMFEVPAHTYIVFMASAGYPCMKDMKVLSWIESPPGDSSFATTTWWRRTLSAIRNGKLFPDTYNPLESDNRNVASAAGEGGTPTTAFYEPGDLVQDSKMSMYNSNYPLMMSGVWTLPVSSGTYSVIDAFNDEPEFKPFDTYESLDKQFLDKPGNLFRNVMFPPDKPPVRLDTTLYDVLHSIPPGTADKPRFIIVHSCRSIGTLPTHTPMVTGSMAEAFRQQARRLSVASRRRTSAPAAGAGAGAGAATGSSNAGDDAVYLNRVQLESIATDFLKTYSPIIVAMPSHAEKYTMLHDMIDHILADLAHGKRVPTDIVHEILVATNHGHRRKMGDTAFASTKQAYILSTPLPQSTLNALTASEKAAKTVTKPSTRQRSANRRHRQQRTRRRTRGCSRYGRRSLRNNRTRKRQYGDKP